LEILFQFSDRKLYNHTSIQQRRRKYFSDGYCIYAIYIPPEKHQVLPKTQLTRVEGENTRLRHYLGGAYAPDRPKDGTGRIRVRIASSNLHADKSFVLLKVNSNAEVFR